MDWIVTYARRIDPGNPEKDSQAMWRLAAFLITLLAELATILITWQVWGIRDATLIGQLQNEPPPNLPLVALPAISFGVVLLVSMLPVLIWPRVGVFVHGGVLLIACLFDQHRLEPQFMALWLLLWGCVSQRGAWFARWFLASMWLWAGLHKLLSPEWFGVNSWDIVKRCGFNPHFYLAFAWMVSIGEMSVGLAAIFTRKIAAVLCLVQHVGILLFLSPLFYNFNESVWPWNAATAIVGAWLFWTAPAPSKQRPLQWAVVAALYLVPATYYLGWINPHFAHILYSDHMPKAWISSREHTKTLHSWGGLEVPFPDSHWLFLQCFERTASPGDKLYIQDPRTLVENRYYQLDSNRRAVQIDREMFLAGDKDQGEVVGVEFDDENAAFLLERSGAVLERNQDKLVESASWHGQDFTDDEVKLLAKLPNLEELEIRQSDVRGDLAPLKDLERLIILDLQGSTFADDDLQILQQLTRLRWINLRDTQVTGDGLVWLATLVNCERLDLGGTDVDDASLAKLANFQQLEALLLDGTNITDQGLHHLKGLTSLQWIDLSGTRVRPSAAAQLQKSVPGCKISIAR